MLGQGGLYYGRRFSNLTTNGDLETGDTTNWNNLVVLLLKSNFSNQDLILYML